MTNKNGQKSMKELSLEVEELSKVVNSLQLKIKEFNEKIFSKNVTLSKTDSNTRNTFKCKQCHKKYTIKKEFKLHVNNSHSRKIKCNKCQFEVNSLTAIEEHMIGNHRTEREYKCSKCDNAFMSELRLMKHMAIHQFNFQVKNCHYYNNSKDCPYELFGCKFQHIESKSCRYGEKCEKTLCQFKHSAEPTKISQKEKCDTGEKYESNSTDNYNSSEGEDAESIKFNYTNVIAENHVD